MMPLGRAYPRPTFAFPLPLDFDLCPALAFGSAFRVAPGSFVGAAAGVGTSYGLIYYSAATTRVANTATNSISGGQGSAVELQYIGNNQFMPVSSSGILWAN